MSKQNTVLIRADANAVIGSGHVGRCIALAQEIQGRGDRVIFAATELGGMRSRIEAERFEIVDLPATRGSREDAEMTGALYSENQASWLIADGYEFKEAFQRGLEAAKVRSLLIDDYGQLGVWRSQFVLDQNLGARQEHYANKTPDARLLMGSSYVLLRREFRNWKNWKRAINNPARNLLVTFGGGDAREMFERVVGALALIPPHTFNVVFLVGPNPGDLSSLKQSIVDRGLQVRLEADTPNMPGWLTWADVAISAAGSTCWEMCYLGLPAIVFALASNQVNTAQSLFDGGAVKYFGDSMDCSPEAVSSELLRLATESKERERMSQAGRSLIDGRGAQRVAELLFAAYVRLRPVTASDSRLLWEWANDPEVRKQSFTQETISWPVHDSWFQSRLAESDTLIRIAENQNGDSIGVVRFKLSEENAVVSISLAQQFRGLGLAATVLKCALQELAQTIPVRDISAYVKPENLSSLRLFERAGFVCKEQTRVKGQAAMHLVLQN
ncbi:MAG: UDP-2,4-diacetamido-2,4,6-trideoxy-beta-L-altropyranose hydrolase [Acidobacteria bacterium]|nr:MAG: UDP-2,4-diacetamido-2,4,6-trideoxy-beta-L-altropyranose hydrolase [Acidobacteriota bacterium]